LAYCLPIHKIGTRVQLASFGDNKLVFWHSEESGVGV
jgi:hypothetical protein